jgi:hypothetical protein
VKNGERGWEADFPIREQVEDYAGRMRRFVISCDDVGLGFTVRAREEGHHGAGYEFAAYSETTPYNALFRLRQKMYRGLATRHIAGSADGYRMLHDRLTGRIASDGDGGVVVVVDGIALSMADLASLLAAHEGWNFDLQIVDALG